MLFRSIAAEISQAISQTRDLGRLLAEGVELIWQGFNLYHVQIYLMDNVERNLIIRAGSGQAGHHLVAQRHTLPLTTVTINAVAAHQKRPVLVADVQENSLYRPNPLLPDTRAELAMPLISEQKVLGVLNVESTTQGRFRERDVQFLTILADKTAIALETLQQRERQNATLQLLYELSGRLAALEDAPRLLQLTAELTRTHLSCEVASLFLFEAGRYRRRAMAGLPQEIGRAHV